MPEDFVEYWDARARVAATSELDAVCCEAAPDFLNRYADWSQQRVVSRLLDEIGSIGGMRALDVGSGTGRWARRLAAAGASVVGVDRSATMVDVAGRRNPSIEFRQMDAARLDFEPGAFDLATVVTVLQHLPPEEQERAIASLSRVVRPGGYIIAVDRVGHASAFSATHGTFPRPREDWIRLWRDAGAELVRAHGVGFGYPLRLIEVARSRAPAQPAAADVHTRRGSAGWRRMVLRLLVAASYATDVVAERIPRAPAPTIAMLLRVRTAPLGSAAA